MEFWFKFLTKLWYRYLPSSSCFKNDFEKIYSGNYRKLWKSWKTRYFF